MRGTTDPSRPPDAPATRIRYVVLAWLCAAAMIAYITRMSISAAEETIRLDLKLSPKEMGVAMGAFFLSYAIFQVPTGWLSHLWGSRWALPFFALLGSVLTALFAWAGGFWTLLLTRFGLGAAQAGLFPAATLTMARWFPATQRGLASGLLASCMSIGAAIGNAVTGVLLAWTSWQIIFSSFTLLGLVWAVWFYLWFRDAPEEHPSVNRSELAEIHGPDAAPPLAGPAEPTPWLMILSSPALYWICAQQVFRAAGYIFFGTWFATYLKQTRDVGDTLAGILNSLPLLGVVVGSYLGGRLSDRLLRATGSRRVSRQALAATSHFLCALLILVGYPIPDPWLAVVVITLACLIGSFGAPCAYAITMDMGGRHIATVFSLMNMCGNLGAWLFPMAVPFILGEERNWDLVMLVFAGMYVVAAVCWIPFNANGTIVKEPTPARPD